MIHVYMVRRQKFSQYLRFCIGNMEIHSWGEIKTKTKQKKELSYKDINGYVLLILQILLHTQFFS